MNLKETVNVKGYLKEIDEKLEERYRDAKKVSEEAKKEIQTAFDILKSIPENSSDFFQKALGFWVRDFSTSSSGYSREFSTNELYLTFGRYDGPKVDMRGDIGARFAPTDKKILESGDYRAIVILLPAPR